MVFSRLIKGLPLFLLLAAGTQPVSALVAMEEEDMADVTGTGVAIALNDFRLTASPTSFIEFTGAPVGAGRPFRQTDLRWYGISITGTDASEGTSWNGFCSSGYLDLGCPQGGYISQFAPHDNPLLFRAFSYTGVDFQGVANVERNVFELVFPTAHEPYRFAFWGELNIKDLASNPTNKLQVQNIWNNMDQSGSVLRIFQHSDVNDPTFGTIFWNRFKADIRMSVNQSLFSPNQLGMVPEFTSEEGMYIGDYRLYFPMGQLHYQSTIFKSIPDPAGNRLVIEQTLLPNRVNAYNDFYGRTISDDPTGGVDRSKYNALGSYERTHGYLRMGDWAPLHTGFQNYYPGGESDVKVRNPVGTTTNTSNDGYTETAGGQCMPDKVTCTKNGRFDTNDGMFFVAAPGRSFTVRTHSPHYVVPNGGSWQDEYGASTPRPTGTENITAINLGDARIEGLLVQHLRITLLGVN